MASDALVVTGGGVGNLIQATPLIQAAAYFHESPVDVWLAGDAAWLRELIYGHESVRRVSSKLSEAMGPVKRYKNVYYTFLRKGRVAKKVPAEKYFPGKRPIEPLSEVECNMFSVRSAGYVGPTFPTFCCYDEPDESFEYPAGKLVGIATGSKRKQRWTFKRYPHYGKVSDFVLKEYPQLKFLHVGLPTDDDIAPSRDHVVDVRRTGVSRQQVGLISKCIAFIGNDSGLPHIAAALGLPTVVVFGPTVKWKNLPPRNAVASSLPANALACQPCQYKRGVGILPGGKLCGKECLIRLPPRQVADTLLEVLQPLLNAPPNDVE
jgi:hypothetical protein